MRETIQFIVLIHAVDILKVGLYAAAESPTIPPDKPAGPCNPVEIKPPKCGINEVFDECPTLCPARRCDIDDRLVFCPRQPKPGDPQCKPGCRCANGYYRNFDGVCVTRDQCPKCNNPNEVYECAVHCPPQTCESLDRAYACPIIKSDDPSNCTRECRCKPGYYRNIIGECISEAECKQCSGPHEYFTCGGVCDNVCATLSERNKTNCPDKNIKCSPKCYCEDGFARDDNNICIPIDQCKALRTCNKPHEMLGCRNSCPPRTCEAKDRVYKCPPVPQVCIPDCVCQRGFYRNKCGACVTKEECPPTCNKPHEIVGCKNACPPRTCEAKDRVYKCAPEPQVCLPECVCDRGFYRNKDGACVTKEECTDVQCPRKNEEYGCVNRCVPQTCEASDRKVNCLYKINPSNCTRECRCKPGYYRNKIGECISKKQCDQCRGPHEFFSCGGACDNVCSTLSQQNQTHCPIINIKCNPKCYCEKGYARDANNTCIPIAKCPAKCGLNEEYDSCLTSCPPRRCDIDESIIKCKPWPRPGDPECKGGCRCKDNYYRNNKGVCVLKSQCQPICGINEVYDVCPAPCPPRRCDVDDRLIKCAAPPKPGSPECKPGCRCADGYYRNNDGVCVTRDQCPVTCNKPHEIEGCKNACPPRTCEAIGRQYKCPPVAQVCFPECVCDSGFYRNNDGACVPIEECPNICPRQNEVYGCVNNCVPQTCEASYLKIKCLNVINPSNCTRECRCKPGYYRNKIGDCISKEQCDQCRGPHEFFSCGGACDNVCSTLSQQNQTHCPIINIKCNPKCYCEEGYARDANNTCIPIAKCPAKCGLNEEYDSCLTSCPPRRCDIDESIIKCKPWPRPGDPECKGGCRCKDNYYRNNKGVCVLKSQCQPICGINEVYDECPAPCPPRRCDVDDRLIKCAAPPKPGSPACKPGCRCADGYYRNNDGVCVTKDQCPVTCHKPHEIRGCRNACPPRTCDAIGRQYNCPPVAQVCIPECVCESGFYRNKVGACVPIEECPNICPRQNEEYGCVTNCVPQTCEASDIKIRCLYVINPSNCTRECRCKPGYYRNKIGDCISKEQCDQCRGPHEFFSCGGACDNVCSTLSQQNQTHCPIINIKCNPKCYCEKGYARDANNTCIPIAKCPAKCGLNEEYDTCLTSCPPRRCDIDERLIKCVPWPKPGDPECKAGCRCKDNYYRNNKGVCVLKSQCQPICGINEVYDECPAPCPPRRCDVDKQIILCVVPPKPGSPECKPGCRCADGYFRNNDGVCVTRDQCPVKCNKPHEIQGCKNACPPRTCEAIGRQYKCPPVAQVCIPECVCDNGFYRNKDGACVPTEECPNICPRQNEVYGCINRCIPQTCEASDRKVKCLYKINPSNCTRECRCKPGYYRNKIGECISKEQCDQCRGPHEFFSCGGACDNVCSTLNVQNRTRCPIINIKCNPKCYCEDGYARDANNTCIPIANCPAKCGLNEEYDTCLTSCPPRRCDVDERLIKCVPWPKPGDPECKGGCRCKDNYYRNNNGVCVLKSQCQPKCGINEIYDECPAPCPPRRCDVDDRLIRCAAPPKPGSPECKPGCRCADGYYRNKDGICVTRDQCEPPIKCRADEVYNRCANGGCGRWKCSQPGIICIDLIEGGCKPGCRCKAPLLRTDDGRCVPSDQCPKQCGLNEEYIECQDSVCRAQYCSELGYPLKCLDELTSGYTNTSNCPGCVCQQGYVRNKNRICIPEKECPSCGGDPNAESGCSTFCQTCDTYPLKVACKKRCKLNGCECKQGFIYDTASKKCVLPQNCPKYICTKPNEVYQCKVICPPQTCDSIGKAYSCPAIFPTNESTCIKECRCKPGYYRNKNGDCIPKDQCPNVCTKPNEVSECKVICPPQTCDSIGKRYPCPFIKPSDPSNCTKECRCKPGYYRNTNGDCIPKDQCPNVCTKPNEVSECKVICPPQTCDSIGNLYSCPAILPTNPSNCTKECRCKPGYYRNTNGDCIPKDQCPNVCTKPNEVYECGITCPPQTCDSIGKIYHCPLIKPSDPSNCTKSCRCKSGYYRNKNGECIPKEQCPNVCTKPNEVSECKVICPPQTCDSIGKVYFCPAILPTNELNCTKECRCKPGYYRNTNGDCIPKDQCPNVCTKPDEVYECRLTCPPQTCDSIGKIYPCPLIKPSDPSDCVKECRCKPGYYRNANGDCISKDQCQQCGVNEEYVKCKDSVCRAQSCSELGYPLPCQQALGKPDDSKCNQGPGCVCQQGYVRNNSGICIPAKQCPSCGGDPNAESGCGGFCKTCDNYSNNVACTAICKINACDCKEGYIYDTTTKKCVLPKNCPKNICTRPNEVNECKITCPPQTCDSIGKTYGCPLMLPINPLNCTRECRCKPGYYRNKNGECIPKDQCPNVCKKPNEVYECKVICPPQTCDSIGNLYSCPAILPTNPSNCTKECRCKPGYYRNTNGDCIPKDQCPNVCKKPNEVYDCKIICPPQTCDSIGKIYHCPLIKQSDPSHCLKECRCKPGYYRNANDDCISKDQCQKCTGSNEFFACGGACDNECSTLGKQNRTNCPIKNIKCNPKCYCKDGYSRDNNKICIPNDQCPVQCKKNEIYVECPDAQCEPKTCSEVGFPVACPGISLFPCKSGCVCNYTFVKDANGICIPKTECPSCGGDVNAVAGCGTNCNNRCFRNLKACPDLCDINGCDCKPGFLFDDNLKKCVRPGECSQQCGVNEEYVKCKDSVCRAQSCSELGYPLPCQQALGKPDDSKCNQGPGCVCQQGYVRNNSGICIPAKQCPSCGGDPNAESGCGGFCKTCDNYSNNVACTTICKINACDCKEGYIYDKTTKKCVLPKNCPNTQCPGANQEFGCALCVPQTCSTRRLRCLIPINPDTCKRTCRCKPGYYKNAIGECISAEDCDKCTGPHEFFSCGGACDNECSTLGKQNRTNCPIKNKKCNPKCYCEDGYSRDKNNTCIPNNKCPVQCKKNEIYLDQPDRECRPQKCSEVGFPLDCPGRNFTGCVCDYGYVKDENDVCIPKEQCPSCGGDDNAVTGCGVYCNTRCSKKPKPCPKICYFNSCDCKPGFLLDETCNKCVLPRNCPHECNSNNEDNNNDGNNDDDNNDDDNNDDNNNDDNNNDDNNNDDDNIDDNNNDDNDNDDDNNDGNNNNDDNNNDGIDEGDDDDDDDDNNDDNDDGNNDDNDNDIENDDGNSNDGKNCIAVNSEKQFIEGNRVFTGNFLMELIKNKPGQSVVSSPFSLLFLIAILGKYTKDNAQVQILEMLNFNCSQQIRPTMPQILYSLRSQQNITSTLVEKVYGSENYPFSEAFKNDTRDIFDAESQNLDFTNPTQASKIINDWVASQTNNLIKDLVPKEALNANTRLVLVNAIYFKGNWKDAFKKENTRPKDFYVCENKTVTVQMMNRIGSYKYKAMSQCNAQILELPYKNPNFTFNIILPSKTEDGLMNALEELRNSTSVLEDLQYTKVNVSMPKFQIDTSIDIKVILKELDIFKPGQSGLVGILKKPEDLYVSDAFQKAAINVTEDGTEAAAGNAIIVGATAVAVPKPPVIFNANYPFIYLIRYKSFTTFCGLYNGS